MFSLKNYWQLFSHNYCWSDYVKYIDGWVPKLALSVPIIGYLILFNDKISDILVFEQIANEGALSFGLSGIQRLRLIYFGLILLGISNAIYLLKKPYQFRFGTNIVDYTRTCLEVFTLGDYMKIHGKTRHEGHLTLHGKYYDSEWEGFQEAATNTGEGTDKIERDGNWETAKSKYGGLLRSMLTENFFRINVVKRFWLSICLVLSTIGYFLLLIPSGDLFIKVVVSTFSVAI